MPLIEQRQKFSRELLVARKTPKKWVARQCYSHSTRVYLIKARNFPRSKQC